MSNPAKDLSGRVDLLSRYETSGWAMDRNSPSRRVEVCVLIGENVVATLKCDLPRSDLGKAGIPGDGNFGFSFRLPEEFRR